MCHRRQRLHSTSGSNSVRCRKHLKHLFSFHVRGTWEGGVFIMHFDETPPFYFPARISCLVAQVSNLLCRRLPVGKPFELRDACGLEIREREMGSWSLRHAFRGKTPSFYFSARVSYRHAQSRKCKVAFRIPIPKGLRHKAQGCLPSEVLLTKEGEATLGRCKQESSTPTGLRHRAMAGHNHAGVAALRASVGPTTP